MTVLYVQVVIPHENELPQDAVINTFHFSGIDDLEDMITAINVRLKDLYNATPDGVTYPIKDYLSGELDLEAARAKYYDLSDSEPRAPVADLSLGITSSTPLSTSNMPGEVAICTSYSAAVESGERPARRRGRLYIGPFNVGASDGTGDNPSRPKGSCRTTIAYATRDLAEASTLGATWVVWSRVNEAAYEIVKGYVDDAWDTQRRRGVAATSRLSWEVETTV